MALATVTVCFKCLVDGGLKFSVSFDGRLSFCGSFAQADGNLGYIFVGGCSHFLLSGLNSGIEFREHVLLHFFGNQCLCLFDAALQFFLYFC